ncbi:MAG TPA: AI-2E family transporter [Alphaproteobacteria bacterium]|jgi:predicted PurR-regulated permease PerM|nr:AI-2E family transporter [Alphaproteobacteria bacterium]
MARRLFSARPTTSASGSGAPVESLIIVGVVTAALYLGRAIAIPVAIAVLISFSLGPAVSWLHRRHFGRIPAILAVVVPVLFAVSAMAYVVTTEVGRLAGNIPAYRTNIETKIDNVANALPSRAALDRGTAFLRSLRNSTQKAPASQRSFHGHETLPQNGADGKPIAVEIQNPELTPIDIVRAVVGPLVEPVSDTALVLLFVIFFLAEKETLRDRIIRLAGVRDLHRTTRAMDEAGTRVSRYLLLQTVVNVAYGSMLAVAFYMLGLPNAALWGGLATMLRFIPYLGVIAASVLPLLLAFAVDPGWQMLAWTAGVFLALELVTGNVVEPWLYGSSTGLSAVALVLSAIFWTWLWGAIGLLLATPLTVCIAVVGRYVPQLAFLDVLLGNQAPLRPHEAFYQRLLAGRPDEAVDQAEEYLRTHTLSAFLSRVAGRALLLAERDRLRGALEDEYVKQVADGTRTVLDTLNSRTRDPREPKRLPTIDSDVVICAAGRSELDEAASVLLARALDGEGRTVVVLPYAAAIHIALPDIDPARIKTVCLSYLDPEAVPHARYLARRFRRRVGADISLIAAFWGMEQDAARLEHAQAETRADRIVCSLDAAVEAVRRADKDKAGLPANDEPDLEELAAQISRAIGGAT